MQLIKPKALYFLIKKETLMLIYKNEVTKKMKKMKIVRMKKGINSKNFAKSLGITYVYLSKIEMGHLEPSVELAEKIAVSLGAMNCDFRLLDNYPSSKRMQLKEFIDLSNQIGYVITTDLFDDI